MMQFWKSLDKDAAIILMLNVVGNLKSKSQKFNSAIIFEFPSQNQIYCKSQKNIFVMSFFSKTFLGYYTSHFGQYSIPLFPYGPPVWLILPILTSTTFQLGFNLPINIKFTQHQQNVTEVFLSVSLSGSYCPFYHQHHSFISKALPQ